MDTLTVSGVGYLDGEYPCDIPALLDVSSHDALTVAEAHFIRQFSDVRGAELAGAFIAGDMAVRSAIAYVILVRAGKRVAEEMIWQQRIGWAQFELGAPTDEEEAAAAADPTDAGAPAPPPSTNGGPSSNITSESQDAALLATGPR